MPATAAPVGNEAMVPATAAPSTDDAIAALDNVLPPVAPPAARRLQTPTTPWDNTEGDFCGDWLPEANTRGQWCFVHPTQTCDKESQTPYTTKDGYTFTMSSGPCTRNLSARSEYSLQGLRAMEWPLKVSAVLGVMLLILAGCGNLLFRMPSKIAASQTGDMKGQMTKGKGQGQTAGGHSSTSLQSQFAECQSDAVRKLNDSTPDAVKFTLYGYFKQAKEGDVQGDRPGIFNDRERKKFDAWTRNEGMSQDEAMEGYIKAVRSL